MGKQLVEFYERAYKLGGYPAKVELARLTKVPSSQAEEIADTPYLLTQFENALRGIRKTDTGNHGSQKSNLSLSMARLKLDVLKKGLTAAQVAQKITEAATKALGLERSSIWQYDPDKGSIACLDLYSTKDRNHSRGVELFAKDFPIYFKAIKTEKTILADDAHRDPRTSEFSSVYLAPLGINSMLDIPIWRRGKFFGVLCNEHTGNPRKWSAEEEDFGYSAAALYGLVLD